MAKRTTEERMKEFDIKIEQIKARKRQIQNRVKAEKRKEETKRLITIGKMVEEYCGEIKDLESFAEWLKVNTYAIAYTQNHTGSFGVLPENKSKYKYLRIFSKEAQDFIIQEQEKGHKNPYFSISGVLGAKKSNGTIKSIQEEIQLYMQKNEIDVCHFEIIKEIFEKCYSKINR
jgi:REP element-mobilizing transposase RayT